MRPTESREHFLNCSNKISAFELSTQDQFLDFPRSMQDGEHRDFVASDHIIDAIILEPSQPQTNDERETNGIKHGIPFEAGDGRFRLGEEIAARSRHLRLIPNGCFRCVGLSEGGLVNDEIHRVGDGRVSGCHPKVQAIRGVPQLP